MTTIPEASQRHIRVRVDRDGGVAYDNQPILQLDDGGDGIISIPLTDAPALADDIVAAFAQYSTAADGLHEAVTTGRRASEIWGQKYAHLFGQEHGA